MKKINNITTFRLTGELVWYALCVLMIHCMTGVPLQAEKRERDIREVASVAILKFINNTGSSNYDWLRTSLPDAVNESMLKVFEYRRTPKEWVQGIADQSVKEGKTLMFPDIRFIAENTSSDIIIYGSYIFDDKSKKIFITTKIFHLSRDSITSEAISETPVNDRMFSIVDRIALASVDHIKKIALEDRSREEKLTTAEGEKGASEKGSGKGEKIILKKATAPAGQGAYVYDSWNMGIYLGVPKAYGFIQEGTDDTSANIIFETSTSFEHFWQGGARFSYIGFTNTKEQNIPDEVIEVKVQSLQALGGINFRFFNRIILQPMVAAGITFIYSKYRDSSGVTQEETSRYAVVSWGVKVPVRMFGIFATPYIEMSNIIKNNDNAGALNIGLGINF